MRMKENEYQQNQVLNEEIKNQIELLNENLKQIRISLENIDRNFYQLAFDIINFKR